MVPWLRRLLRLGGDTRGFKVLGVGHHLEKKADRSPRERTARTSAPETRRGIRGYMGVSQWVQV